MTDAVLGQLVAVLAEALAPRLAEELAPRIAEERAARVSLRHGRRGHLRGRRQHVYDLLSARPNLFPDRFFEAAEALEMGDSVMHS